MQTNMKKYFCYSFNEGENLTATHNLIRVEWRVELKDNGEEILYDHWDMGALKFIDLRVKYWAPRYNNDVMGKEHKEFAILKDINSERDLINFMKVFKKKAMAALKEAYPTKNYKEKYESFETKIFKLLENALTKEIRETWEPPLEIENQFTYLHKDGFENSAHILTNNGFYYFSIRYFAFMPQNYNLVKNGEPDFNSCASIQSWGIYKLPGDLKHPLITNDEIKGVEVIKEDKYSFSEEALKTALKKMKLSNNQIEDFLKRVNEWFETGKKAFLIKINPLGCFEDYKIFPQNRNGVKPSVAFKLKFERKSLRGILFYDKPLTFKWGIRDAGNHTDIYRTCDSDSDSLEVLKAYLINNLKLDQDKAFEITEALWNSFEDHGEFTKEEPEVEREDSTKEIVWHYTFTTADGKDGRIIVRLDEDFLKGIVSKFCNGGCRYIDGPNEMNFGLYIAVHGLRGSFESEILSKGKTDCRYYKRNVWSFEQTFREQLPKEIWEEAYKTLKADLVDKFWAEMKPKKPE